METFSFPQTWDNTMRMQLRSCPRKFYFFMQGYDYALRPPYFVWGEAWHEILRVWYDVARDLEPQSPEYWQAATVAISAGEAIWDEAQIEDDGDNKRDSLEKIFMAYLAHYPQERWKLIEGAAETGFEWPIAGTNFFIGGSIDARLEEPEYGTFPREDKSSGGYLMDSYLAQWYYSSQVLNYTWYENQLTGGNTCLVNCATKKIPGPRSQWTTPRFARIYVQFDDYQLEEHIEATLEDISYAQDLYNRNYFPKTPDSTNCVGGIGKSPCLFRDYCRAKTPKDQWMNYDLSQFSAKIAKGKVWEPWKRKGEA